MSPISSSSDVPSPSVNPPVPSSIKSLILFIANADIRWLSIDKLPLGPIFKLLLKVVSLEKIIGAFICDISVVCSIIKLLADIVPIETTLPNSNFDVTLNLLISNSSNLKFPLLNTPGFI